MTDILDRLRAYSTKWHPADAVDLAAEAVDEIERLRNLVDQCDHHEHSLQDALADIERLRNLVETCQTTELKAAVRAYPREFVCARCAALEE